MRFISRLFLYFAILPLISSCGFSPIYGKNEHNSYNTAGDVGVEDHMALIKISNIPGREGQFLRNQLVDRLYRHGAPSNPAYTLNVSTVNENLIDLDITKTADSTRGQLRLDISIVLNDPINKKTLFTRSLRSITSYNILASEFSTRVSEQAARENALRDLARQIENQLALYFKRQNK